MVDKKEPQKKSFYHQDMHIKSFLMWIQISNNDNNNNNNNSVTSLSFFLSFWMIFCY
eukprot:TRINITY_DN10858_c1_g1_i1.p1 TRINITY_DN10858_c1_g1~~TRINITY_DN10858_c1_g1_i1.p1  ORF type:complete len:57 (+),score=4.12 TRINITY_DN10858_c1_g1_i1:52-222(+)